MDQQLPESFISHSHQNKNVARRLSRELTDYGFRAWIDEAQLRFGAALTAAIRAHIEQADVVLVVASEASSVSKWVVLEMEHARQYGKTIVPFFIEPVATKEL